jgi:hypothetical protein
LAVRLKVIELSDRVGARAAGLVHLVGHVVDE